MKPKSLRQQIAIVGHPVFAAMNRKPIRPVDLASLRVCELLALCEFAEARAGRRAWQDLEDMRRVAVELGQAGIGPEALPVAAAAWQALARSWRPSGGMGMPAVDLSTLRELQALHDQQRELASRHEYLRANLAALAKAAS